MQPAKRATLVVAVACLITWRVASAEATPFLSLSVNVDLDHPDLSDSNPINWSVTFPPIFSEITTLRIDASWVGDGLDPEETILYRGVTQFPPFYIGMVGVGSTALSRSMIEPGPPAAFMHFLDGSEQGVITTGLFLPGQQPTAVTFEGLTFTFDGTTAVAEPGSLLLVGTGILAAARKLQRRDRA